MLTSPRYGVRSAAVPIPILVYGTGWCAATQQVRRYFDRRGIPYRYVDLERDARSAAQLAWLTGGYLSHPTVSVGGEVLVEPSVYELERALARAGVTPRGWW